MTLIKDPKQALALCQEVWILLKKGGIEQLDRALQNSGFYSTYFIIAKKDDGFHPILDLRSLNTHLKVFKFHMLCTVDLLQSRMIGLHPSTWKTYIFMFQSCPSTDHSSVSPSR